MADDWNEAEEMKKRRSRAPLIGGAIVVALVAGVWLLSQNIAGVTRGAPPTPTVNLLPPPPPAPPPPPPPKEPPPPEKTMDAPKPEDQPKADNQPKQLTINGPAQAGSDAFGIAAGRGGGSSVDAGKGDGPAGGADFADANYRRLLKAEIQQAIQSDARIEKLFSTAIVAIWVDPDGRLRRSKIRRGTGDDRVDADIIATLRAMPPLRDPPPARFPFPTEVQIKGARRG